MDNHGKPLKTIETHGTTIENHWKPLKIIKTHVKNYLKTIETIENH